MEGILTLIIVIIVFNLINALLKAIRGDRTASKKVEPVGNEVSTEETSLSLKKERIDPFLGLELQEVKPEYDSLSESDPDPEQLTEPIYLSRKVSYRTEDVVSREDGDSKTIDQAEEKLTPCLAKALPDKDSVKISLKQVLSQKEPLVAAFIFHEVLGLPPSKRGKR